MPLVKPNLLVSDPTEVATKLAADLPDGFHELGKKFAILKVAGEVVSTITIVEYKAAPDDFPPTKTLTRIGSIYTSLLHRKKGYGKQLLLWLIRHHDAVESGLDASVGGDAVWKSIKGNS